MAEINTTWLILGGVFLGVVFLAILTLVAGVKRCQKKKGPGPEGFAHYPPYRQENGPYQNNSGVSPNHKEWRTPNTGVNSTFSVTGQPYASLSQVTNEETPIQGVDIFGSRFGPGYITPARGWWNQVSDLNAATGLQVTRPNVLGANSQPNSSIWVDPSTLRQLQQPINAGANPLVGRQQLTELRENYVDLNLDRDDSVPKKALEPTVKRTRESTHTGWGDHEYDQYRNPMLKSCTTLSTYGPPFWPLHSEYPFRDGIYDMKITNFFTASNNDPENLSAQRLWPKAQ